MVLLMYFIFIFRIDFIVISTKLRKNTGSIDYGFWILDDGKSIDFVIGWIYIYLPMAVFFDTFKCLSYLGGWDFSSDVDNHVFFCIQFLYIYFSLFFEFSLRCYILNTNTFIYFDVIFAF